MSSFFELHNTFTEEEVIEYAEKYILKLGDRCGIPIWQVPKFCRRPRTRWDLPYPLQNRPRHIEMPPHLIYNGSDLLALRPGRYGSMTGNYYWLKSEQNLSSQPDAEMSSGGIDSDPKNPSYIRRLMDPDSKIKVCRNAEVRKYSQRCTFVPQHMLFSQSYWKMPQQTCSFTRRKLPTKPDISVLSPECSSKTGSENDVVEFDNVPSQVSSTNLLIQNKDMQPTIARRSRRKASDPQRIPPEDD